jgi:enoyl-CoA hydratase/carnithine racemase
VLEYCRVERDGPLFIVTLDRPEVRNALHPPANFELEKVFDEFCADPDLWLAIITGAGDHAFCAGNDLKYQAEVGVGVKLPAMGMLLTGRSVSAEEGRALGFVNEVVRAAEVLPAARRWAEQILECAPLSVRASKEAALQGLDKSSLEEAVRAHYAGLGVMLKSDDYLEGPRAFAEKRKPNWKGR